MNSYLIIRHVNIISYHPTKQPINKRTYVVRTLTYIQSHHVLINKSWLCRYTWEQTHAITLNTTTVSRSLEDIYYYNNLLYY